MRWSLLLFGLLAAGTAGSAAAESLRVSPVRVDLASGQPATTLTLRNDGDTALNVQVRVMRWTQVAGQDQLEPTQTIAVSPPIGEVAPHSERLVRIVRLGPAPTGEETFRLLVDELPPAPGSGDRQIRLLMRHSVPLFSGAGASKDNVRWSIAPGADTLVLNGVNSGGRHLRIANVKILSAGGDEVTARQGLVGYVLPNSSVQWTFPVGEGRLERPTRLLADTDAGPIDVRLADAP